VVVGRLTGSGNLRASSRTYLPPDHRLIVVKGHKCLTLLASYVYKIDLVSMKLQIVVSESEATTVGAIMQRPVQVLASIALPSREVK
jgi:hypothetical protein